jgi:CRP-like cAMP-binding protein
LLDFIVVGRRAVHRGQTLYRAGDPFEAMYAIRAGFFKTTVVSRNGDEHVTGLRMAGDILGLDGIATRHHTADALALDHGEVCMIPYANLLDQALHSAPLQRTMCTVLGREITRDQDMLLLLGGMVVPLSKLPGALRIVAEGLPAAALATVLHRALSGASLDAGPWIVLAVWAVGAPVAAALTFRWE